MIQAFSNEFIPVFQIYISSYCEVMKGKKRRNMILKKRKIWYCSSVCDFINKTEFSQKLEQRK